jgi:hypothetical protein
MVGEDVLFDDGRSVGAPHYAPSLCSVAGLLGRGLERRPEEHLTSCTTRNFEPRLERPARAVARGSLRESALTEGRHFARN